MKSHNLEVGPEEATPLGITSSNIRPKKPTELVQCGCFRKSKHNPVHPPLPEKKEADLVPINSLHYENLNTNEKNDIQSPNSKEFSKSVSVIKEE